MRSISVFLFFFFLFGSRGINWSGDWRGMQTVLHQAASYYFVSLQQHYLSYVIFTSLTLSPCLRPTPYTALLSHALCSPLASFSHPRVPPLLNLPLPQLIMTTQQETEATQEFFYLFFCLFASVHFVKVKSSVIKYFFLFQDR